MDEYYSLHRRTRRATDDAALLREENAKLKTLIETFQMGKDEPLWRRIANQRREIKAAWAYAEMYRKWWRRAEGK